MDSDIIPFSKEKHLPLLKMWHSEWRLPAYMWDCVPEFGFLACNPKTNEPVAAMLLRHAEGGVVIIDYLITSLTAQRPSKTVDKLLDAGIKYAKEKGIKSVMAVTRVESLIERAKMHGFETYPMTYLIRKRGF